MRPIWANMMIAALSLTGLAGCNTIRGAGAEPAPPPPPPEPPPVIVSSPPPPAPSRAMPTLGNVFVRGTRVSDFRYLRDDIFRGLATTDAGRRARLEQSPAFGPFAVGSAVNVFVGEVYYFFPMCGGHARLEARQVAQLTAPNQVRTVRLTCP